jgi:hypothetical protein
MRRLIGSGVLAAAVVLLGALAAPGAHAKDSMELVIGNGPHAETYRREEGKGWIAMCGHFPGNPQLFAVFKDMSAAMKGRRRTSC